MSPDIAREENLPLFVWAQDLGKPATSERFLRGLQKEARALKVVFLGKDRDPSKTRLCGTWITDSPEIRVSVRTSRFFQYD